jgi:glycosyltransferase involved in cell wall biosynthesis
VNILQISSAASIGGGERHLVDLADGLVARGHQVTVAARRDSPLVGKFNRVSPDKIRTVRLRNSFDFTSAMALRRLVREHSIDVIHAHLARDYPLAAIAVRGLPKTRLILTRHVLFPLGRFHRLILGRASAIIAVSSAVRAKLIQQGLTNETKIRVIHNGIDIDRFAGSNSADSDHSIRQQLGFPKYAKLVGSVGSLVSLKGHGDLIRAAAIVSQTDPDTYFVIIGDERPGDQSSVSGLRELIAQTGMAHRVKLMRGVADVAPWLGELDLFVSASHTESFGLAIVEALAAGCAVLATATEGATEVLENGKTGQLIPVGDVAALAAGITDLLAHPKKRARLGEQGRAQARLLFNRDRMVAETERLYFESLNSSP